VAVYLSVSPLHEITSFCTPVSSLVRQSYFYREKLMAAEKKAPKKESIAHLDDTEGNIDWLKRRKKTKQKLSRT
jgi:hypothetical protein